MVKILSIFVAFLETMNFTLALSAHNRLSNNFLTFWEGVWACRGRQEPHPRTRPWLLLFDPHLRCQRRQTGIYQPFLPPPLKCCCDLAVSTVIWLLWIDWGPIQGLSLLSFRNYSTNGFFLLDVNFGGLLDFNPCCLKKIRNKKTIRISWGFCNALSFM